MFGLPKTTEFNKKIPKQKFYEKLDITPASKRVFVEQIKAIYWTNKIAASTVNLAVGKSVTELEVFKIELTSQSLDLSALHLIDKAIPYHIIFALCYNDRYQLLASYKGSNTFFSTSWLPEPELQLPLNGLDLDSVYEAILRYIAGDELKAKEGTHESLQQSVERAEQRQKLMKQIDKLQKKVNREVQFSIQVELNAQLKALKRELEQLMT